MNTKEELRDILEEHHSIVTDELGERLITALDEYIQDRESALLSRAKELVGEDEESEYKKFDPNGEMIIAEQLIFDLRNELRATLREELAKELNHKKED